MHAICMRHHVSPRRVYIGLHEVSYANGTFTSHSVREVPCVSVTPTSHGVCAMCHLCMISNFEVAKSVNSLQHHMVCVPCVTCA